MPAGFELFDHTADVGVRAFAPDLAGLLQVAGQGLYAVIGELVPEGDGRPARFSLADEDPAVLLRDYLAELLLIFERDHRMITDVRVEVFEAGQLVATGESRAVSRAKSLFDREVKAVTYHELQLGQRDGGYELTYIVDI